jgi:hypothetical protein
MGTIVTVWAYVWLVVVIVLALASRRLGRTRMASWLVLVGLFLLSLEEPLLTFWLGWQSPKGDPDGMATLITPMARVHAIDSALFAASLMVLLGWIAFTAFRRGERWALRVLGFGLAIVAIVEVATSFLVFSRGLPLPGPGGLAGRQGFGWHPVMVGLLAWGIGLWLRRSELAASPSSGAGLQRGESARRDFAPEAPGPGAR